MRTTHFFSLATCAALTALTLSGCYEVEETIANVTVLNEFGSPVQGATVRLYAFGSTDEDFIGEPRFDTTDVTNAAGLASFNFSDFYVDGQVGFAVLDIDASKASLEGNGLIKVEEMTTSEAVVYIE